MKFSQMTVSDIARPRDAHASKKSFPSNLKHSQSAETEAVMVAGRLSENYQIIPSGASTASVTG